MLTTPPSEASTYPPPCMRRSGLPRHPSTGGSCVPPTSLPPPPHPPTPPHPHPPSTPTLHLHVVLRQGGFDHSACLVERQVQEVQVLHRRAAGPTRRACLAVPGGREVVVVCVCVGGNILCLKKRSGHSQALDLQPLLTIHRPHGVFGLNSAPSKAAPTATPARPPTHRTSALIPMHTRPHPWPLTVSAP